MVIAHLAVVLFQYADPIVKFARCSGTAVLFQCDESVFATSN